MGNTTANQAPLIKASVYSEMMLEQINEGLLPEGLHRDVSDFGDGSTLYIPLMGETVLRDYVENSAIQYDPVDTGQITLTITEYVSAATYVTNKLKQDAYKAAALEAGIPSEHLRVIEERWETDLLSQQSKQTASNRNAYNGFDHRWVAGSTTTGLISLKDFLYAKLSMDKAQLPENGRLAIVDPIVEATLNNLVGAQAFTNNPQFEGLVETGFGRSHRFVRNIYGFDIWVSNRLARIAAETITGGPQNASTAVTAGVANLFICNADEQHTPFMGAMRQPPKMDGEYNKDFQRDEYVSTARWGFGLQRPQSLITVITDDVLFA
ncbi:MAG: hypothetical protein M0P95_17765 [Sulfuritalea sp.]|jgi:hypothetical protein|nr:hypothetical protein [Sulfuritalea sp.]